MKKVIAILLTFSLPALFFWFEKGSVVDGTDIIFPLDPLTNLNRSFFAWEEIYNTGSNLYATQLSLVKFPIYLFFSIFQKIGFSITFTNKLYYFSLVFFPMLTMFIFLRELLSDKKNIYWKATVVASVFYVYNLFYLQQIIDQAITLTCIFTPLILYLFLKGVKTERIKKYALIIGITSIFYTPINPNSYAVGILIVIGFILSYFFYYLIKRRKETVLIILKMAVISALFSLFFSAVWIIPYFHYLTGTLSNVQSSVEDWLPGVSKNTSFTNVVRLIGAWDWFEKWNGEDYAPYANYILKNPIVLSLAYVPIIVAAISVFVSKRKIKYFFVTLLFFGIILSMGSHSPTGWIYMIFYDNVPAFWIFRSPWYKFGVFITFSASVLIALFLQWFYSQKWLKWGEYFYIILLVLFIAISYPLFKGDRFIRTEDRKGNLAPLQVKIPEYVFKTTEWLNATDNNDRVALVPQVAWESSEYTWGYGNLMPPVYSLLRKNPMMILPYERTGPGVDLMRSFKDSLYNPNSTPSANFLAFLNTRYVLLQNDYWYYYFRSTDTPQKIKSLLKQQGNLKFIKSFGKWEIYENSPVLPKIYGTSNIYSIIDVNEVANLPIKNNPVFVINNLPRNLRPDKNLLPPKISFKRVSPVEYEVSTNSKSPFYLVFQEAYHNDWQIKSQEPIENVHFKANSYANGYFIKASGNNKFLIYFAGQKYYYYGQLISAASIISVFVFFIFQKHKQTRV